MIVANFNSKEGWVFNGEASSAFGISFQGLEMDSQSLAFGWSVLLNGETHKSFISPVYNFVKLDSDYVFGYSSNTQPDDEVVLSVWVEFEGEKSSSQISFVIPRPPQPYPSWEWDGAEWQPPTPYPADDVWYEWDEAEQEWATVDLISEQGDD